MKKAYFIHTKLCPIAGLAVVLVCWYPAWGQAQGSGQARVASVSAASAATDEEREVDKQHLLAIYKALKAYEKDQGKLPDWLSDLVPKYIQDTNVLVSPYFVRTGT